MNQLALTKATVLTPFNLIEEAIILVQDKKIINVGPSDTITIPPDFREVPLEGLIIAPGFIDQHLHGGGGRSVMDGTPESLIEIGRFHATHGVTSFLATTVSGSRDQLETIAKSFAICKTTEYKGARCIGLHLEGPYLASQYAGAHSVDALRAPSLEEIKSLHCLSNSGIKMITMAPELSGAMGIAKVLVQDNIICSIGHSSADFNVTLDAIAAGFSNVAHCYNQMRPFHHRDPGLIGAALTRSELLVELIVDGVHLHPATVDMVWRIKGPEGIILVSDAMAPTGMLDGTYQTSEGELTLSKGSLKKDDGNLAGSVLTLDRAVKQMLQQTNCDLTAAFRMATYNPARLLGINKNKGSLYPGKDADLIVLTTDLEVVMTMVEGEVISGLISL